MVAFDQPATLIISVSETPLRCAAEVAAALVLCGLNTDVSTPAILKDAFTQREIVSLLTGPCGFTVLTKSLDELRNVYVLSMYTDNVCTMQIRQSRTYAGRVTCKTV